MSRVYIAGPMRGIVDFNFPAFDAARDLGISKGYDVHSPADLDRVMDGEKAFISETPDWNGSVDTRPYLVRDVAILSTFTPGEDAVALLPGWETSRGARAEIAIADWVGLKILDARTFEPFTKEEMRTASTGGQKGVKPERYDLIPWDSMDEVARVYAYGAKKYDDRNWEKGYSWGDSIAALFRHARAFAMGQSRDVSQDNAHHLASVVFHALALMRWERTHPELDNRSK